MEDEVREREYQSDVSGLVAGMVGFTIFVLGAAFVTAFDASLIQGPNQSVVAFKLFILGFFPIIAITGFAYFMMDATESYLKPSE